MWLSARVDTGLIAFRPLSTHVILPCCTPIVIGVDCSPAPKLGSRVLGLALMIEHFGRGERQATNRASFHHRRSSCPMLRSAGTPFCIASDTFKEKDGIRGLGNHTLPGFFVLLGRWRGRPRTHAE